MGNCCKSEEQEVKEQTDYNHEDIYKTRPPCWYHHECPCPCHDGSGPCMFKIQSK